MRILFIMLMLIAAASSGAAAPGPDQEYVLTVLHTNDTHGRPLAFERRGEQAGGIPARKTAIDLLMKKHPDALLLDAGDVCDGMPVSNMNGAEPDFAGMALLGYDAMAVGNHEFSHDLEEILALEKKAGFPFLCANLVRVDDGTHPFEPSVIVPRGGRNIAILGLITPELERMVFKERLAGLELLDPLETARNWVPRLRSEADHVIVVSHCGYGYDTKVLAPGVKGIDLIVGGHSHSTLFEPERIGNTVVVQAGAKSLLLGLVILRFDGRDLAAVEGGLIPINFTPHDPEHFISLGPLEQDAKALALLRPYADKLSDTLKRVVGRVNAPAEKAGAAWLDHPFGNLVADAMRTTAGADCAIQNAGGIRTRIGPGPVTAGDVMTMLPFDNNVIVVRLKGSRLLETLKHCVYISEERPRIAGALSGIKIALDPLKKGFTKTEINGEPLDENRVYTVAVNSYMFQGGDGYAMLAENEGAEDAGFLYSEALIRFLEDRKTVTPASDGRIRLTGNR